MRSLFFRPNAQICAANNNIATWPATWRNSLNCHIKNAVIESWDISWGGGCGIARRRLYPEYQKLMIQNHNAKRTNPRYVDVTLEGNVVYYNNDKVNEKIATFEGTYFNST